MPESTKSPAEALGTVDFEAVSAGVLDAIRPVVEREMREASNQLYGATMEAVQDYLSDNVNFNIRSRLNAAETGRRAEWERAEKLNSAVIGLLDVIDAAGLRNLANGVQLGPTVWFVKASDAVEYARQASIRGGEA